MYTYLLYLTLISFIILTVHKLKRLWECTHEYLIKANVIGNILKIRSLHFIRKSILLGRRKLVEFIIPAILI